MITSVGVILERDRRIGSVAVLGSLLPVGAYEGARVLQLRGAGVPVAQIPHTTSGPQPEPAGYPMIWERIAPSARHLIGPDAVGRPQPAGRAPFITRGPDMPADAMSLDWNGVSPAHRALFGR